MVLGVIAAYLLLLPKRKLHLGMVLSGGWQLRCAVDRRSTGLAASDVS